MKKKILISTGGTGGHVIPATIFYEQLKDKFDVFKKKYQITKEGNFEGSNILVENVDINLSDEEKKMIQKELSEDFKSPLNIDYEYDSNLIGGLIMQVESVMIDTSIKNKLQQIGN